MGLNDDSALEGWYRFNGDVTDGTGTNNGTVTGTTTFVDGKNGSAFDFDQSTRISLGTDDSLNITPNLTIALWINYDDLGGASGGRILERYVAATSGYAMAIGENTGNKIWFFAHPDETVRWSTTPLTIGPWFHVAVTVSSTAGTFYRNGSQSGTFTLSGAITSSAGTQAVLGNRAAGDRGWDGRMDEVRIYSRALTQDEIKLLTRYPWGFPLRRAMSGGFTNV